jgi:hypothetical protein
MDQTNYISFYPDEMGDGGKYDLSAAEINENMQWNGLSIWTNLTVIHQICPQS